MNVEKIADLQARTNRARDDDAPELPPVEAYEADIAAQINDTDIANGARLVARHGENLRSTMERGCFVWNGKHWLCDEKMDAIQGQAKETALSIFDEIRGSTDPKTMFAHARRSQSKKSIEAMIWLAQSEPGIAARITEFDSDGCCLIYQTAPRSSDRRNAPESARGLDIKSR